MTIEEARQAIRDAACDIEFSATYELLDAAMDALIAAAREEGAREMQEALESVLERVGPRTRAAFAVAAQITLAREAALATQPGQTGRHE
jgi:hypothetical protein